MHTHGRLLLGLLLLAGCRDRSAEQGGDDVAGADGRPAVRYLSVTMQPATTRFGPGLAVDIELEARATTRLNGPHVNVFARCDGSTDEDTAFFSDLSHAEPGDRKIDVVTLFDHGELAAPPRECQLTLSLSEGSTPPRRSCFDKGKTRPGAC